MESMSMSMADSPTTAAMTGMPMATATPGAMDMLSHSSLMGMNTMAMTFFTSTTTPLFSTAWTPASTGQYAGTCIFLIAFATIFRALLAIRLNFFDILAIHKRRRGDDQILLYATDKQSTVRPWRASEAVMLASMDVVLGGVGYLLMVAVMTMNVGYFLSVLAGIFLGSLVFGRFMVRSAAH